LTVASAQRVHIVEPDSSGRISGGYLYNQKLEAASGSRMERHAVRLESLASDLGRIALGERALVLADSLFLNDALLAPFLSLRRPGVRLGMILHAFPSFIERAGHRRRLAESLPLMPTPGELANLTELDLVVAPGPYVPRLLSECDGSIHTLVCPPGIDEELGVAAPRARPARAPVQLLSMGGVTPLKGFADGIEALARAEVGQWSWTIVGHLGSAPEHVRELRGLAEARGLTPDIHFLGQRSHEETLALLGESDLVLLPSYTENHPLVAMEALCAGVPVVGYEVGGVPDIVEHERSGLLSPLLDVDALSRNLARLIRERETRDRLSRGALLARRSFTTWEESAQQLLAALDDTKVVSG
jgi:glycosyltransferase involved in cell wall biosynthesis